MASLWGEIVPLLGAGSVATWLGNAAVQIVTKRGDLKAKQSETVVQVEQHRDKLMLELLEAARDEASAARSDAALARQEAENLRPYQVRLAQVEARLAHHEEALEHLRAVLSAPGPEERRTAERLATAFLTRMRRLEEAAGTMRNEMQRAQSAVSLPIEMQVSLDKLA